MYRYLSSNRTVITTLSCKWNLTNKIEMRMNRNYFQNDNQRQWDITKWVFWISQNTQDWCPRLEMVASLVIHSAASLWFDAQLPAFKDPINNTGIASPTIWSSVCGTLLHDAITNTGYNSLLYSQCFSNTWWQQIRSQNHSIILAGRDL